MNTTESRSVVKHFCANWECAEPIFKFSCLPWDIVRLIIDYIPLNAPLGGQIKVYQNVRRLNRDIYRMINSKRKSLLFKDRAVTEKVFLGLINKASGTF